ncbi:MAG: hypothetical protein ACOY71_11605 [Gemmatimonadota bacterium]
MSDPSDLQRVRQEIIDRLDARGIVVHSRDRNASVADLLDAVERWETAVEQRGGDLMVDDRAGASEPDDPHFVLPVRGLEEPIEAYRLRVEEAIDMVRRHRKRH